MEAPDRIEPQRLGDYLEVMSKAAFQTGISWKVVENKWPGIKEALRDFDPVKIAQFSDKDIDDLTQDTRVIRNRRKLEAIVANARRLIELEEEHGRLDHSYRDAGVTAKVPVHGPCLRHAEVEPAVHENVPHSG